MGTNEVILSVKNLAKNFGGLHAVRGVDFEVERGAIVGLIGPNGAGKTTTIKSIWRLPGGRAIPIFPKNLKL